MRQAAGRMGPTRAASACDERDESLTHEHDHALALLSATDIDFINGLRDTASRHISDAQGFGGLLEAISAHLDHFEREIIRAGTLASDQPWHAPLLSDPWGPVRASRDALDAKTVEISGPGANDRFEVVLSNPGEAMQTVSAEPLAEGLHLNSDRSVGQIYRRHRCCCGFSSKPCQTIVVVNILQFQRLKEIRGRCLQLVQKQKEMDQEQKHLKSVSPSSLILRNDEAEID